MKQTTIVVYKVLCKYQKKLFSLNKVVSGVPTTVCQRYWTNRTNYPKTAGTKIMAFGNYHAARQFSNLWPDTVIYEAEAVVTQSALPPHLISIRTGFPVTLKTSDVEDFGVLV